MKKYFTMIVLALALISCGREGVDEHADFIGVWEGYDLLGRDYLITIEEDGSASYLRVGLASSTSTGAFWINKGGDKVKIAGKKFDLLQYPEDTGGGNWEMTIDDIYLWTTK
jgi:hypothetical protein